MTDYTTDIFGTREQPTDYLHRPVERRCVRVSLCCWQAWMEEDGNRCILCKQGTGWACCIHEDATWENERETVCDEVLV